MWESDAIFIGQAGVNLVLTIILLILNRSILGKISLSSLSAGFIRKMTTLWICWFYQLNGHIYSHFI